MTQKQLNKVKPLEYGKVVDTIVKVFNFLDFFFYFRIINLKVYHKSVRTALTFTHQPMYGVM